MRYEDHGTQPDTTPDTPPRVTDQIAEIVAAYHRGATLQELAAADPDGVTPQAIRYRLGDRVPVRSRGPRPGKATQDRRSIYMPESVRDAFHARGPTAQEALLDAVEGALAQGLEPVRVTERVAAMKPRISEGTWQRLREIGQRQRPAMGAGPTAVGLAMAWLGLSA